MAQPCHSRIIPHRERRPRLGVASMCDRHARRHHKCSAGGGVRREQGGERSRGVAGVRPMQRQRGCWCMEVVRRAKRPLELPPRRSTARSPQNNSSAAPTSHRRRRHPQIGYGRLGRDSPRIHEDRGRSTLPCREAPPSGTSSSPPKTSMSDGSRQVRTDATINRLPWLALQV